MAAHQLKIRQISGGLSNLVFCVALPPGTQPQGGISSMFIVEGVI